MANIDQNVDEVFALYETIGEKELFGNSIPQTSHAIQTAMAAEAAGQPPEVILGALLHDIGILVGHAKGAEKLMAGNIDIGPKNHDALGEAYLKEMGFPLEIYCFAIGHCNAKRYKAYKDKDYREYLSFTSLKALEKRGGPMTEAEAKEFQKLPHYDAIVACTDWDEKACGKDIQLTPLSTYKAMAKEYLKKK